MKWWQTDGGCGPRPDYALFAMIFYAIAFVAYMAALVGMILESIS